MSEDLTTAPQGQAGLKRIFANLAHLLGGKAAAGIISLGYLAIVPRALGAHDYGILVMVHGFVMLIASIVTFSGWHVIVHFGAQALNAGDHPRLMKIVRSMVMVEFALGLIAIGVAIGIAPIVGPKMGWSPEALSFVGIYSLAIITCIRATSQGLVQLVRRVDLLGKAQVISPLIRLFGAIAIWLAGGGLKAFLALWLAAAIIEGIAIWLLGFWAVQKVRGSEPLLGPIGGVRSENEGFLKFATSTNIDITLRDFAPAIVPLIVGWLLGPAAVGLLSLAQRAMVIFQHPAKILGNSAFSVFVELVTVRNFNKLRRIVLRTNLIMFAAAMPILLIVYIFSDKFIMLLGGASFSNGGQLMFMLAVGQAIYLANPTFAAALTALGRAATTITVNISTHMVMLPMLVLFIHLWGLNGVGWHAILAGIIASLSMMATFSFATRKAIASAAA